MVGFMTPDDCVDNCCGDECEEASPPTVICRREYDGDVSWEMTNVVSAYYGIYSGGLLISTVPLAVDAGTRTSSGTFTPAIMPDNYAYNFVAVNECFTRDCWVQPCDVGCNHCTYENFPLPGPGPHSVRSRYRKTFDLPHCTIGCTPPSLQDVRALMHNISGIPAPWGWMNGSYITSGNLLATEAGGRISIGRRWCSSYGYSYGQCPYMICATISIYGREPDGYCARSSLDLGEDLNCFTEDLVGSVTLQFTTFSFLGDCITGYPCNTNHCNSLSCNFLRTIILNAYDSREVMFMPDTQCLGYGPGYTFYGAGRGYHTYSRADGLNSGISNCPLTQFDKNLINYTVQWI